MTKKRKKERKRMCGKKARWKGVTEEWKCDEEARIFGICPMHNLCRVILREVKTGERAAASWWFFVVEPAVRVVVVAPRVLYFTSVTSVTSLCVCVFFFFFFCSSGFWLIDCLFFTFHFLARLT